MNILPVSVRRMPFGFKAVPAVSRHIIAIDAPVLRASIATRHRTLKADGLLYLSIPGIQATDRGR
jgi:hypothetical protein